MGYTHYYKKTPKDFDIEIFTKFSNDVKKVHEIMLEEGIQLAGGDGTGKPIITTEEICFNGYKQNSHETFYIQRKRDRNKPIYDGVEFEFCKTVKKPYDVAVTLVLMLYKHYFPTDVILSSDGDYLDWLPARILFEKHFNYELSYDLKTIL